MYAVQVIQKMQRENIKSWVPRKDVTDKFNQHVQVNSDSTQSAKADIDGIIGVAETYSLD